jgi:uncharacterized protein (DUF433 family)
MTTEYAVLYKGHDPRTQPAYTLTEAAHYINLPVATLRSWVLGRHYTKGRDGKAFSKPVILLPSADTTLLSFNNLVEGHILSAIRRKHQVRFENIRRALDYVRAEFKTDQPLLKEDFVTDGIDLFVERFGALVNVSQRGQVVLREALEQYLQRIDRDEKGLALRLFPIYPRPTSENAKIIAIDPFVAFGKRIVARTGIPTSVIAERYQMGESISELAEDYGSQTLEIEEAIRCELRAA